MGRQHGCTEFGLGTSFLCTLETIGFSAVKDGFSGYAETDPFFLIMSASPQIAPPPVSQDAPPPKARPNKRLWWLAAALPVAALLAILVNNARASKATATLLVKSAKAAEGPLVRTIRVSGQTAAINYVNITAPIPRGPESSERMVIQTMVPSGTMVKKGQVVAALDAQGLKDHIDDLGETVRQAEADVDKRRAEQQIELENYRQTLRLAKADWEKAKLDAQASEVKTDVERELLQLAVEQTDAKYKQLTADLKYRDSANAAELRVLELTAARHREHRSRHMHDLEAYTVHSPMDGLAVAQSTWRGGELKQVQEGDQVYAGTLFMKVVNPNTMQVEARINQAESNLFRLNQPVKVRVDAFSGLELPGHIESIGAIAASGWGSNYFIRSIPLVVKIDAIDSRVIPDLSASADVQLAQRAKAVQIPRAAVVEEEGKTFAFVRGAVGFRKRPITLGLETPTMVEVKDGIKADEEVRLN